MLKIRSSDRNDAERQRIVLGIKEEQAHEFQIGVMNDVDRTGRSKPRTNPTALKPGCDLKTQHIFILNFAGR